MSDIKITPEMIVALNEDKNEIKSLIDQNKGRLGSLKDQLAEASATLASLGVTPETAPGRLEELESQKQDLYTKANDIITKIKEDIAKLS